MKKYWTVSIVWTKNIAGGGLNISNSLIANIEAIDKDQAFGKAYADTVSKNKEHQLFCYGCLEQNACSETT